MKILFGIIVGGVILFGGYLLTQFKSTEGEGPVVSDEKNVSVVENRQIIEIRAKGGYMPKVSVAKAGLPTTLRVKTEGTFDCSSALRIPRFKVSQNLPPNGITDIDLGVLEPGLIQGNCSMGMYPFLIEVQE